MSVRQISKGNYEVRRSVTVDGKAILVRKRGFATKRDAETYEAEILRTRNVGGVLKASRMTLNEYAVVWLEQVRHRIAATTLASYTNAMSAYILPTLGPTPLRELSTSRLQEWVNTLRESGKVGGGYGGARRAGKPLSPKSIRNIHGVLHSALDRAVILKHLAANPADNIELPRKEKREMKAYDADQLAAILQAADADKRWAGIWWLLFMAGIRRGEILGLTWEHVNLDARTVRIELNRIRVGKVDVVKAPKTEKGRRTIELDEVTIDLLREWRTAQMAERLASGSGWLGGDLTTCYVVTEPNGSPTHSSSFGRRYRALLKRAGVPIYALHEARHTSITQLAPILSAHALSRRAGHSSVAFTYDRYAHAMPQESFDAINALSAKVTRRRAK